MLSLCTLIARAFFLHIYFVVRVFLVPNAYAHTLGGSLLVGIGVGGAVGWSGTRRGNLRYCFMHIQTTVEVLLVHVLRLRVRPPPRP